MARDVQNTLGGLLDKASCSGEDTVHELKRLARYQVCWAHFLLISFVDAKFSVGGCLVKACINVRGLFLEFFCMLSGLIK